MLPWAWDTLYLFRNVVPTGFHLSQRCWQNYKYDNFLADSIKQNYPVAWCLYYKRLQKCKVLKYIEFLLIQSSDLRYSLLRHTICVQERREPGFPCATNYSWHSHSNEN